VHGEGWRPEAVEKYGREDDEIEFSGSADTPVYYIDKYKEN
tara:strand:- start:16507 stop:16629 length:123 start_codon:yes stop_codon:yes gene_type:complete